MTIFKVFEFLKKSPHYTQWSGRRRASRSTSRSYNTRGDEKSTRRAITQGSCLCMSIIFRFPRREHSFALNSFALSRAFVTLYYFPLRISQVRAWEFLCQPQLTTIPPRCGMPSWKIARRAISTFPAFPPSALVDRAGSVSNYEVWINRCTQPNRYFNVYLQLFQTHRRGI